MVEFRWVILCRELREDPAPSGLSVATLIGVSDRISAPLPARVAPCAIAACVASSGLDPLATHAVDMRVLSPSGYVCARISGRLRVGMDGDAMWTFTFLDGILLPEAGAYLSDFVVDGAFCGAVPVLTVAPALVDDGGQTTAR